MEKHGIGAEKKMFEFTQRNRTGVEGTKCGKGEAGGWVKVRTKKGEKKSTQQRKNTCKRKGGVRVGFGEVS